MRILRFAAFFVSALFCLTGWSQTTPTAPAQQPAAAQGSGASQAQPQPPARAQLPSPSAPIGQMQEPVDKQGLKPFKLKLLPPLAPKQKKLPTGTVDRGFRAALETGVPRPQLRVIQEGPDDFTTQNRPGDVDPGIRLGGYGNMCGAIVSYNFSRSAPGEMPKLETVTTCTPADKVVPRRTEHKQGKPKTPTLLQTVLPQ